MGKEIKKDNFVTHQIGLHYTSYLLSKNGIRLSIDNSVSDHGHISMRVDKKDIAVMSKSLSELVPIPFTQNEIVNMDKFDFIFLVVGVYYENPTLYKIPVSIAKERMKNNVGKNGKTDYWIDVEKYREFQIFKFLPV